MNRTPVRIPPAPPTSANIPYKRPPTAAPRQQAPPSKPQRGKTKSSSDNHSTFFVDDSGTLSNKEITFTSENEISSPPEHDEPTSTGSTVSYVNIPRKGHPPVRYPELPNSKLNTYEIPDAELLKKFCNSLDVSSIQEAVRQVRSAPTSPILGYREPPPVAVSRAPPVPAQPPPRLPSCPDPPPTASIYQDPNSLFTVAGRRRTVLDHPLADGESSGSMDDFIIVRRKRRESKPQRPLSEIIGMSDLFKSQVQDDSVLAMFRKSVYFGNPGTRKNTESKSTFYLDREDLSEEKNYETIEPHLSEASATSKIRNMLTPAIFNIPSSKSTFYTDTDHIYCSTETISPKLQYAGVSVENQGYRNPKLCQEEEKSFRILLKSHDVTSASLDVTSESRDATSSSVLETRDKRTISNDSIFSFHSTVSDNISFSRSDSDTTCNMTSALDSHTETTYQSYPLHSAADELQTPLKPDPKNVNMVPKRKVSRLSASPRKQIVSMKFSTDTMEIHSEFSDSEASGGGIIYENLQHRKI